MLGGYIRPKIPAFGGKHPTDLIGTPKNHPHPPLRKNVPVGFRRAPLTQYCLSNVGEIVLFMDKCYVSISKFGGNFSREVEFLPLCDNFRCEGY